MDEIKICKICKKQKIETLFARDPKLLNFFHTTCLEKLKLLLKIKNSDILNRVDLKSLEIIFNLLLEDIPDKIILLLNQNFREEKQKFRIELDQDKKLELDIISKAFGMDPEAFIKYVLIKEIDYIQYLLDSKYPKEELEEYYGSDIPIEMIDMHELRKLILVGEVL